MAVTKVTPRTSPSILDIPQTKDPVTPPQHIQAHPQVVFQKVKE